MSEKNIFPAINTQFGSTVIKMTQDFTTEAFWETSEEHLISVAGLHVTIEKNLTNFSDLVYEVYNLLQGCGCWKSLSQVLLSTNNNELKDALLKDALFQFVEGWKIEDERIKDLVIVGSLNRLQKLLPTSLH